MTDKELKELIEDCCNDIFDRLEPLANVKSRLYERLKPAINFIPCCTELKDKTGYNNIEDTDPNWMSYVEDMKT